MCVALFYIFFFAFALMNFWLRIWVVLLQTLNRSESMVSLCFRSLTSFVLDDNLPGLQAFLENKQVQVDDKDEVCAVSCICFFLSRLFIVLQELKNVLQKILCIFFLMCCYKNMPWFERVYHWNLYYLIAYIFFLNLSFFNVLIK